MSCENVELSILVQTAFDEKKEEITIKGPFFFSYLTLTSAFYEIESIFLITSVKS